MVTIQIQKYFPPRYSCCFCNGQGKPSFFYMEKCLQNLYLLKKFFHILEVGSYTFPFEYQVGKILQKLLSFILGLIIHMCPHISVT